MMRRFVCLMITLLIGINLLTPVMAAADFVPSITYKDGPTVDDAQMNGEDVGDCVVVTSIKEAKEKTTDITQEERDLLLEVYEALNDGSMTLPLTSNYTIRELVDVSFEYNDCRTKSDHNQKDVQLKKEGTTITIDFDLGVSKDAVVIVLTYIDGEWKPIESVTNNGDGTVTCVFEDICPVVFCVEGSSSASSSIPKTGDMLGANLGVWVALMAVSATVLVVLMSVQKKRK